MDRKTIDLAGTPLTVVFTEAIPPGCAVLDPGPAGRPVVMLFDSSEKASDAGAVPDRGAEKETIR